MQMREILFRGKRTDNGEWAVGLLTKRSSPIQIGNMSPWFIDVPPAHPEDDGGFHNVDPATIGQYTGLTTAGKRIFEGDIFQYGFDEVAAVAVVKFGEFGFGSQFDMNQVGFYVEWNPHAMYYRTDLGFWAKRREIEIIGNIHDNPELLEGGADG